MMTQRRGEVAGSMHGTGRLSDNSEELSENKRAFQKTTAETSPGTCSPVALLHSKRTILGVTQYRSPCVVTYATVTRHRASAHISDPPWLGSLVRTEAMTRLWASTRRDAHHDTYQELYFYARDVKGRPRDCRGRETLSPSSHVASRGSRSS